MRESASISAWGTFSPVSYFWRMYRASTRKPESVFVVRMKWSAVRKFRRGSPAQFLLISENNRCSIGFHLEAPGG